MTKPWSREEFENQLREKGKGYHIYHPFHVLMYEGKLTKEQLQRSPTHQRVQEIQKLFCAGDHCEK